VASSIRSPACFRSGGYWLCDREVGPAPYNFPMGFSGPGRGIVLNVVAGKFTCGFLDLKYRPPYPALVKGIFCIWISGKTFAAPRGVGAGAFLTLLSLFFSSPGHGVRVHVSVMEVGPKSSHWDSWACFLFLSSPV